MCFASKKITLGNKVLNLPTFIEAVFIVVFYAYENQIYQPSQCSCLFMCLLLQISGLTIVLMMMCVSCTCTCKKEK